MSADVTVLVWRVVGELDPVVLLHGQPGSGRDWNRVRRRLPPQLPVVAPDRPGYDGVSRPGGIAHSARAVIDWMDNAGVPRAHVAGLSFGGGVAAWLAAEHPQRVSSLLLISPAANRAALQRIDRLLAAPLLGPVLSTAMILGAGVALRSPRLLTRRAVSAVLVEQRAMLEELPALEAKLDRITAPTTIMIGTADTVVPPNAGRLLADQIRDARLVEIGGARHGLTRTHPEQVAQLISRAGAALVS